MACSAENFSGHLNYIIRNPISAANKLKNWHKDTKHPIQKYLHTYIKQTRASFKRTIYLSIYPHFFFWWIFQFIIKRKTSRKKNYSFHFVISFSFFIWPFLFFVFVFVSIFLDFLYHFRTSLFIITSLVYAMLLIVVCVAYVISDVSTHRLPIVYYEGFFTYLYGASILFLLYVFCFLLQGKFSIFTNVINQQQQQKII